MIIFCTMLHLVDTSASLFLKGIVFPLGFTFARTQFNVNEDSTFLVFERLFQWTNYPWNHILLVVTFSIHLWTRHAFKRPILLVMFELCPYEFALGFPDFVGEILFAFMWIFWTYNFVTSLVLGANPNWQQRFKAIVVNYLEGCKCKHKKLVGNLQILFFPGLFMLLKKCKNLGLGNPSLSTMRWPNQEFKYYQLNCI